jgi:uncharacterized membrane protein
MSETAFPRRRFAVVDIARGIAIIAMIAYHLCWDLSYYRFISADVGYDPQWVVIARTILSAFLFLVGFGLVLGHDRAIRWRAFWKRWIFVAAGAALISLGTLIAFPASFVYFGVLHAIALFSVLALPFLLAPSWVAIAVALPVLILPWFYSAALFNEKAWSWIGFWEVPPPANDLVPIFPWFGVVLLGIAACRSVFSSSLAPRLSAINPIGRLARVLRFLGRWSLLIYLLHQPLLLALIYPAAAVLQPQIAMRQSDFLQSCQSTCEEGGTAPGLCRTYCQCGLQTIEDNDLWEAVYSGLLTAQEQTILDASNRQCSAVIYPDLNAAAPAGPPAP